MISAGLFSSILFFVIAIGVLVTFHEFGHYWVARKLNVKVLRFSIGFGKPLLTVRRRHGDDEIEYVIAAIPLGGYVKMLDEREAPVELHNKHRAFNNQPILKRAAIVAAGPIFNFILAIFLYWIVLLNGEDGRRPVIFPAENSLAMQAGFSTEDEILAVGTVAVTTWQAFRLELIDQGIDGGKLPIQVRTAKNELLTHVLNIGERHLLAKQDDVTDQLGFSLWQPVLEPVIGDLEDHGAAQRAGLQRHDKILAVDGDATAEWPDVVKHIQAGANQTLMFSIERNGVKQDVKIIPNVRSQNGKSVGYIGAGLYVPEEIINKLTVHIDYTVFDAASNALAKTWSSSQLILRVLGKMLLGEASLENISGPITIATYAGISASISLVTYLGFLAIISVSLGVLNLLPVPMLDGGHLLYYLIEVVKGSPVSDKFEEIAQQVGLAILLMLMVVAMYNDIQRLLN